MNKLANARRATARMAPVPIEADDFAIDDDAFELDERAPEEIAREEAMAAADRLERERVELEATAAIRAERSARAAYDAACKLLPHAYAMVQDERGGWYAVHLEGVTADKITRLEPNGRREHGGFALSRVVMAMQRRHHERKWGRPKGK
jgi:hypothetical protein